MTTQSTILVKDVCNGTFTNHDGYSLKIAITNALNESSSIVLSFHDVDAMSSSFLNSSIGAIIEENGLDVIKNKILIKNYTPTVASVIKRYISQYSNNNQPAA